MHLSRLKRSFFIDNRLHLPPSLEKLTLQDLEEERGGLHLLAQLPISQLKEISLQNCYFEDYMSVFTELMPKKIRRLTF